MQGLALRLHPAHSLTDHPGARDEGELFLDVIATHGDRLGAEIEPVRDLLGGFPLPEKPEDLELGH